MRILKMLILKTPPSAALLAGIVIGYLFFT